MTLIELLQETRELLAGAAEPDATQQKADTGMVAQWDVDALALLAQIDAHLDVLNDPAAHTPIAWANPGDIEECLVHQTTADGGELAFPVYSQPQYPGQTALFRHPLLANTP